MSDFSDMESALVAYARGEMLVVMDDEDRENEGDIIMAAEFATPEKLGFIIRYTSGIICAPMYKDRAEQLKLPPMLEDNQDAKGTAFTVSCDAIGTVTGVSGEDRALTFKVLADESLSHDAISRPGHIFPLVAKSGGVLQRRGHTEATVDLCGLSGTKLVGIISELTNDDGTMMRLSDCTTFAKKHGLKLINIEQMARFRQAEGLSALDQLKRDNPVAQRIQLKAKEQSIPAPLSQQPPVEHFKGLSLSLPLDDEIRAFRIGIIRTSWNESLVKSLSERCRDELLKAKVRPTNIHEMTVPGSYELPFTAQRMCASRGVDAVICFGVLLKGETQHFECVAQSVSQGLMQVQLSTNVPVVYGVLNCTSIEQAKERCGPESPLPSSLAVTLLHQAALSRSSSPFPACPSALQPSAVVVPPCAMG